MAQPLLARNELIKRVHAMAKSAGLDEDTRRDLMARLTGKRSCIDMDIDQLGMVVGNLQGLTELSKSRRYRAISKKPHVRKVYKLWWELGKAGAFTRTPSNYWAESLRNYIQKWASVADPEFLTADKAEPIIESLKAWLTRQEKNVHGDICPHESSSGKSV